MSLRLCALVIATLLIPIAWTSMSVPARDSFTAYEDVKQVLANLADALPPELKSADAKVWSEWVRGHDDEIRKRLVRGDEDTIAYWLLFGTSFTREPMALFEVQESSGRLPGLISRRIKDLIAAMRSSGPDERRAFARQLLRNQGYGLDTPAERARLEGRLRTDVERVLAERRQYTVREDSFAAGDVVNQIMVQSTLFRDRGLSLDTSILACFAIDQALETMKTQQAILPGSVRRVAIIGPGLDFADKNSGYDFYPVQTLQPFSSIDSLTRLGLTAGPAEVELTTFDISPRVNDHIRGMTSRARGGTPYVLRLPTDLSSIWTPALSRYWKDFGNRIGAEKPLAKPDVGKGIQLRAVEVRPQVAARVTATDFNVVTEKWTGEPFDLIIATNVLVYYDKVDQSLAFAAIEGMLRPGGFFLTNNAIVELPASRLRSAGVTTVPHSTEKVDHVFWYRRLL